MDIINSIMTKNPCYARYHQAMTPKGLMLHSVGCSQPTATNFIKNWNQASYDRACVHAFIDANTGVIYQTLPWNMRGWHCAGTGNNTHIGVEMCEPAEIKYTGSGSSFVVNDKAKAQAAVKRTYNSAVELFAFLCKSYNLDPMKDICSHSEGHKKGIASNHADPEHLWKQVGLNYTMDTFRAAVKAKMGGTTTTAQKPASTSTASASSPSLDELAKAVLAGTYGNGAVRKQKIDGLYSSGKIKYSYTQIQNRVNEMLGKDKKTTTTTTGQATYTGSSKKIAVAKYQAQKYRGTYRVVARDGLNLRTNAGTKYDKVATMPYNSKCTCYKYYNVASDGSVWLCVDYYASSKVKYTGYCHLGYLSKN